MATKANMTVDQGATFSTTVTVTDNDGAAIDLTGYTGAAQIRKHYNSSNAVNFSVSITPATGEVTLALTANATGNLEAGRYQYDLEITDSTGVVSRIIEGIVQVNPQVTR